MAAEAAGTTGPAGRSAEPALRSASAGAAEAPRTAKSSTAITTVFPVAAAPARTVSAFADRTAVAGALRAESALGALEIPATRPILPLGPAIARPTGAGSARAMGTGGPEALRSGPLGSGPLRSGP